jgi:hypothetical protein
VASRSPLRASHADREQVIDTLKAAFVQGRLAKDEFDTRIGATFASRTYAELAAITADIPAGLAAIPADIPAGLVAVQPPREPVRALTWPEKAAAWGIYGIVLTIILTIAVVPGQTSIGAIVVTALVIYSVFWLLGGAMMVASRCGRPRPPQGQCFRRARGGALPPPRG